MKTIEEIMEIYDMDENTATILRNTMRHIQEKDIPECSNISADDLRRHATRQLLNSLGYKWGE